MVQKCCISFLLENSLHKQSKLKHGIFTPKLNRDRVLITKQLCISSWLLQYVKMLTEEKLKATETKMTNIQNRALSALGLSKLLENQSYISQLLKKQTYIKDKPL